MFLPGFGEVYVNPRARLSIAGVISIALYPATPVVADIPAQIGLAAGLIGIEVLIGIWIGTTARILLSALHFAGSLAGYASGLANAFAPDMGTFEGATVVASALMLAAVTLIFATNTHHIMIRALMFSYDMIPFGQVPVLGDLAEQSVKAAVAAMRIGLSIAAPFVVMSMMINVGLGLANRAMPNLPVFFIAQSGLIASGILLLAIASPGMLRSFIAIFAEWFGTMTF